MKTEVMAIVLGVFIFGLVLGLFYFYQQQQSTEEALNNLENEEVDLSLFGDDKNQGLQNPNQQNNQSTMPQVTQVQPPTMQIDTTKQYTAVLTTTEGDITIQLNAADTPVTVNNFVTLAKKDFYDNTIFHRVIEGFMIQGGDPDGNGTGGPGYKFNDEPFEGEYTRGTIAMANSGPNTNGSQFFIMHEDSASLPKNYVIFGKVTEGMEVVDAIATAEVTTSATGEQSKPVSPVTVTNVEIREE